MKDYIISIDQSTQGTKALLFDRQGILIKRCDMPHRQIVNDKGWVSHDPEEIYGNVIEVIRRVLKEAKVDPSQVAGMGISNQRETSVAWNRVTGESVANAIVWQCARATEICERNTIKDHAKDIRQRTGLQLSPYFPAAKMAWLIENVKEAKELATNKNLCLGTIDSYLVFRLTGGKTFGTDYSNASRTQLFDIFRLKWDEDICNWFGIDMEALPQVLDSNADFGSTTCEGIFENPIPIHGVMGDSHAALFGQNCRSTGMTKATYGTGSSIMMNIGTKPVLSKHGVVTSLAWGMNGKVEYVLEGNLNYTGAVITWLKDDMELIQSAKETEGLAKSAIKDDSLYLVPAFTGLGAPYWNSHAKASIVGMDRTTRKAELVRAALECIAYQITDIVNAMEEDIGGQVQSLRVDGGPTGNQYLMQFQSDIVERPVEVSEVEELSGIGAAFMAGFALQMWDEGVYDTMKRVTYRPQMNEEMRSQKIAGWKDAVAGVCKKKGKQKL